jgi:Holliday junction resolvase RusA-like endonuclease
MNMMSIKLILKDGWLAMPRVDFWMKGQPIGKGRPRFTRQGRAYTPQKTRDYEHKLAAIASDAMQDLGLEPTDKPCRVHVLAQFEIPKSYSKKRREACVLGLEHPRRGDLDNYVKAVLDAANGVCFEDDVQVVRLMATKRYGDPMILVSVEWGE